jgi:hypothetical protein
MKRQIKPSQVSSSPKKTLLHPKEKLSKERHGPKNIIFVVRKVANLSHTQKTSGTNGDNSV